MANGLFTLKQQLQGLIQKAWAGSQTTPAVEYLVVAGGGAGGGLVGGGGGAGGLLQGITAITAGTSITVTVGSGGSSSISDGTSGQNSVFGNITAIGGGFGSGYGNSAPPRLAGNGGSGGGGGGYTTAGSPNGGSGVVGQGNSGGAGILTSGGNFGGSGGGGAGTTGLTSTTTLGGNGGAGIASAINGTVTTYAGGGGGANGTTGGSGGVGGGGAAIPGGSTYPATGTAGTVNTGGGGGGGNGDGRNSGGSGGSGIVIISYPDIYNAPASFGGANSPTASTSGSGSFSLNGSNQYVTYPQNSAFAFGSSAFTVEFWIYPTSNLPAFASPFTTGSTSGDFVIDVQSTGLYLDVNNNATVTATSSIALTLNAWNHVAVSRGASGSTLYIFINGQIGASVTNSASWTNTGVVTIGKQSNIYVPGYISNLRVVKGTQVYSSAFTPPTAPLTAITNTSLLLNTVSPSAFNDSSTNGFAPTVYNSSTWNQASPFATGLGYKNRVYTWTGSGTVTF